MKILHLSHAMIWGGNEQQLVDLIPALEKQNIDNTVFCFEKSAIKDYCSKHKINYISIKKKGTYSLKLAKKLNQIIIEYGFDIIHMHTSNSVGTYLIFQLIYSTKVSGVFSKKGISDSSSFLSKIKYNFKKIDQIICVSKAVLNNFSKVLSKKNKYKLNLVYDGINLNRIKPSPNQEFRQKLNLEPNTFLIGSIANHAKAKDLTTLIKAINELTKTLGEKNIFCVQIGSHSNLTEGYNKIIKKLNLNGFISLTGHKNNASSLLSQFDCLCFSSKREGLPLTILESFYCETPVISTKAGGIPEAVTDGINGSLVEVGDYKMLANKIKELKSSIELKKKFIVNGKKTLEKNFTNDISALKTIEIYNKAVKQRI